MLAGQSSVAALRHFDVSSYRTRIGAALPDEEVEKIAGAARGRVAHIALACARQATADAGLAASGEHPRIGISLGSGLGGLYFGEDALRRLLELGPGRISPVTVPVVDPNAMVNSIAQDCRLLGQQFTVSTACSSSGHAIGVGLDMIRSGRVDAVLAGGVETGVSPLAFAGFDRLHVMSTRNDDPARACRPFSRDRDGFAMGEGGAMLMLEAEDSARRRGARVYARLLGYGGNGGGYHPVMSMPDGSDAALAMRLALADAGIGAHDIDLVNPHGTGTAQNDAAEFQALRLTFGDALAQVSVTPTKQLTGHLLGAAGAVEALHTVLSVHHGAITPIAYCDNEFGLNIQTGTAASRPIQYAMSNSFGFGNNNATLIFGKHS
jgi:3-oxoacyl-[acyl-carrier-protein] synthase II